MSTLPEIAALTQKGGNTEGGRMNQILMNAQCCAVNEAIRKAKASSCCPVPAEYSTRNNQVPLESTNLEARIAACARINALQAQIVASQPLRGLSEGQRIRMLQQEVDSQFCAYNDPERRFQEYLGPRVPVVCPPLPTEILNANIPKPSTRCDTLNLLATGKPGNSIVSANR